MLQLGGRRRPAERGPQRAAAGRRRGRSAFRSALPHGGFWFESVIRDADAWYGFYHNERAGRGLRRVGQGMAAHRCRALRGPRPSWVDLGPMIETPVDSVRCVTNNHYFVGGVGDFSVRARSRIALSSISTTRSTWRPTAVPACRWRGWRGPTAMHRPAAWTSGADGVWLPPTAVRVRPRRCRPPTSDRRPAPGRMAFPLASPIMVAGDRLGQRQRRRQRVLGAVDPLEHVDRELRDAAQPGQPRTNGSRAASTCRSIRGIDDPGGWTAPERLFQGGIWYPQVIGSPPGRAPTRWPARSRGSSWAAAPTTRSRSAGARSRPPSGAGSAVQLSAMPTGPLRSFRPPHTTRSSPGASAVWRWRWPWSRSPSLSAGWQAARAGTAATRHLAWMAVTAAAALSGRLARFDLLPPPMAMLIVSVFARGVRRSAWAASAPGSPRPCRWRRWWACRPSACRSSW